MAGGLSGKSSPKNHNLVNNFSSEVLKSSQGDFLPKKSVNLGLKGILGLGQTIELNQPNPEKKSPEHLILPNHLYQEQHILFDNQQKQLQQELTQLREEIKKLTQATDNLEKDVANATINPVADPSEYQVKFFGRIRLFIVNFRKNISEASHWVEAFSAKKQKKNVFWNNVKNKKHGGEQYLFSSEHSAARSVS